MAALPALHMLIFWVTRYSASSHLGDKKDGRLSQGHLILLVRDAERAENAGGSIAEFPLLCAQEDCAQEDGHELCGDHGDPDAVDSPDQREQQDGGALKDQRAQEGDQRRGQAVVQHGLEAGGEDAEAHEAEGQRKDPEAGHGQLQQLRVVPTKTFESGEARASAEAIMPTPNMPTMVRIFRSSPLSSAWLQAPLW